MKTNRRQLIQASLAATTALSANLQAASAADAPYRRIATEEAFCTPEISTAWLQLLANNPKSEPGFAAFWRDGMGSVGTFITQLSNVVGAPQTTRLLDFISAAAAKQGRTGPEVAFARLFDFGGERLKIMDQAGIAFQVLSLTSPGVQVFDAELGTALARHANDRLAEVVRANPTRFAGLAAVAPQAPLEAAKEAERAIRTLGLNGVLINSHTKGEYLDEPKFRPLLAKIEELRVPLYLHPREVAPAMLAPFDTYPGLSAATMGFSVETGLHALRLIFGGVFDDFPNLKVILGHMGEGLPFWIDRIDNRSAYLDQGPGRKVRKLRKRPSDYLRENFYITTSAMNHEPHLALALKVMGPERIMFAVDYPYEDTAPQVLAMNKAQITEREKTMIYQTNAERIFGLV
jgi:2,3-dihydroxybenzoate decarboxylase